MKISTQSKILSEKGAVVVFVALLLLVLLGITAFAIDFGYRHVVKNELQNAADAAALSGTRELGKIYETNGIHVLINSERAAIIDVVQNTALTNYAGDEEDLEIDSGDILFGHWDSTSDPNVFIPEPTTERIDAVNVTVRREGDYNSGPIRTFFAGILGFETLDVNATATAALSGQSTEEEGELELPIGVSRSWFDKYDETDFCGQTIKFSPTTDPDACAGWNTFDSSPSNDRKVGEILDEIKISEPGEGPSPYTDSNTIFHYINGDLSEGTFESLMLAFEERGYDVNAIYDPNNPSTIPNEIETEDQRVPLLDDEGNQLRYPPCSGASGNCSGNLRYAHEWTTTIPIYDSDSCNPNKGIKVKGFANVVVYDVGQPSEKTVQARILCDYVEPARGGGGYYGTLGSIPQLVE